MGWTRLLSPLTTTPLSSSSSRLVGDYPSMKNEQNPANFKEPSTRNLIPTGASLTLLRGRDEGDCLEDESARVIWKASQPQDPVLSRLMEDAFTPGNRPRVVRTKSWTPSPNSCAFASSSSTCNASERTSRPHRTNKRRTSSNTLLQEQAIPVNDEFERSAQKLVALLPLVSKQVDENAKREQEAIKQKRRKEKKAAHRLSDGSSVRKKRRSKAEVNSKRRAIGEAEEEEISTAVEDSPMSEETAPGQNWLRREDACAALPSQGMPPPPFVPLRKSWSGDGSFPTAFTQRFSQSVCNSDEAEIGPVELSFNPNSFTATSTPRSFQAGASTDLADGAVDGLKIRPPVNSDSPPSVVNRASTPLPSNDSPSSQPPLSAERNHDTLHNPYLVPPQLRRYDPLSQVPTQVVQSLPKSSGPPVLGMRRLPHTQNVSTSQSRPLPTKREKFKVPFAKPKLGDQVQVGVSSGTAEETTPGPPPQARASYGYAQDTPSYPNPTKECTTSSRTQLPQTQVTQRHSSYNPPTNFAIENSGFEKASTHPCSSPPADGDSSMDFDMGIDPEELERVCSAYD